MELVLSICIGIGLSAACGFRVFVPLLIMSIAANAGHLTLSPGFDWIGSFPALAAFAVATALEVAGYFIPWVDNFLDTVATPAAVVAGMIVTASVITDVSPFLKWSLAVIAGGGTAGVVQGTTVLIRGASSLGTVGLANPVVSTAELGGSILVALLAVFLPVLAAVLVITGIILIRMRLRTAPSVPAQPQSS